MPAPEHKALAAIWINVPAERYEDFRMWHNCEHSTDRVKGPGFQVLHRYKAAEDGGRHNTLNIFEGDTLEAFGSSYYLDSLNNPTPWTRESMKFIRDAERAVYELKASAGGEPDWDAPFAYTVRLNSAGEPGADEELIAWYAEEHLARLTALPGVLRGRFFQKYEPLTGIRTAESDIQKTAQGERRFLSYIELETLDVLGSDAWLEAAFGTPRSAAMRDKLIGIQRERWWLDFAKWTPERRIKAE